ncbi:MAG: MarR family winged helix-turn-helix transcriptional regulator [Bacteroidota bacterium]|jgi:DNA-binding MarR family transcriptional regulator
MDIEKEIGQSVSFKSDLQRAAVNILYTASWLNMKNTETLKPFALTPQQFNVLRILRGQHPKPSTVNLLMQRMLDKSSNASRLVDRLLEKGFVTRETNRQDKRAVDVYISQKGLDVLETIDKTVGLLESHLDHLTESEARMLNDLLDKLRG